MRGHSPPRAHADFPRGPRWTTPGLGGGRGRSAAPGPPLYEPFSAQAGRQPFGVHLSTAPGSSRDKRATISKRDKLGCFSSASSVSGPMALSRCGGVTSRLGS